MNYIHQIQIEKKCRKFDSYNRQKMKNIKIDLGFYVLYLLT